MLQLLYLIPARGGSKGIPKKNIAPVGGRPLIAWSIEAGQCARHGGRIVVSTDSEEIAAVARVCGAEVPFLRPAELARDEVPSLDSVLHALQWLESHEQYRPDYLVLLQPTSPLREAGDIDAAIELALARKADAVVSVSPVPCHPYWTKTIGQDGRLEDFMRLPTPVSRRQELPGVFGLNGAIYLIRPEVLVARRTWYPEPTYAYLMPPERSLDVDTPWDLRLADLIIRERMTHRNGRERTL
jgi:CMP-N-acetylneuraminic acid synthetase